MNPKNYDAIIADYQMPGMNGIEFLAETDDLQEIPFLLSCSPGGDEKRS